MATSREMTGSARAQEAAYKPLPRSGLLEPHGKYRMGTYRAGIPQRWQHPARNRSPVVAEILPKPEASGFRVQDSALRYRPFLPNRRSPPPKASLPTPASRLIVSDRRPLSPGPFLLPTAYCHLPT